LVPKRPNEDGKKVLVVEDDPALRKLVRIHLEAMGHDVQEAPDGKTALARIKEALFDLVCLDLMLPESSGYEVCEQIRADDRHKAVPVLIISARNLPSDRAFAEEVGANAYLSKPFTRADFVARVTALLGP
jgi:two-component system, OmpR family, response regulator